MSNYTKGIAEICETGKGMFKQTSLFVADIKVATVHSERNANRIVECWNACEGMDEPINEVTALKETRKMLVDIVEGMCDYMPLDKSTTIMQTINRIKPFM